MTLEILNREMIAAMKEHNKIRKEVISSLIGAVKKTAIDKKCKDNITEDLVNEVILKEKKIISEMISTCPSGRDDLLEEYNQKMIIVEEFAPKLVTDEEEICKMINHLLAITDIREDSKSAVMKAIMPQLKGKVDMKIANKIISEILSKTV